MRRSGLTALLLLAACGRDGGGAAPPGGNEAAAAASANGAAPAGNAEASAPAAGAWSLQTTAEGTALVLGGGAGAAAIRLFCPAGGGRFLVNVPGFRPIGSEERLSFGSGGNIVALVADTRGDRQRGGVSGVGAVPVNLAALIAAPVSASYGAQAAGPHPAPPPNLAQQFAGACYARLSVPTGAAAPAAPGAAPKAAAGACHVQGPSRLDVRALTAVGTEPFWGARIEGRCVTYSHPEDQDGTRVWTRYTPGAGGGGTWAGALGGRRFELHVRPEAGCSDGMSDRRYPLAVELFVGGERRTGCALPA